MHTHTKKSTYAKNFGLQDKTTTKFVLGGNHYNNKFNGRIKNFKFFYDKVLTDKHFQCFADEFCSDCADDGKCKACHDLYELDVNGVCVCSDISNCKVCPTKDTCSFCAGSKILNIAATPNQCID